jgi:hypothetical protein
MYIYICVYVYEYIYIYIRLMIFAHTLIFGVEFMHVKLIPHA